MIERVIYQHKRIRSAAAACAGLALLALAACGTADPGDDQTPGAPPSPTTAPAPPTEQPTDTTEASLTTETADDYGEILVDNNGMVLYLFTNDTDGTSTCIDQCAATWPPFLTDTDDVTVSGAVDQSLVGTTERDDATLQVTYKEQPLYYYADDAEPGETDGQGVNGVWWLVAPDGSAITTEQ